VIIEACDGVCAVPTSNSIGLATTLAALAAVLTIVSWGAHTLSISAADTVLAHATFAVSPLLVAAFRAGCVVQKVV
jgi:uncharacterized membrane protein YciS (DUF1049 family)